MNIALDLGESYQRLVELEKVLEVHRNGLVYHAAVKQVKQCSSSMHYNYVSLVDKYNGFADIYGKELQRFKTLLDQSVRLQEEVVNAAYKAYTASIASSPAPSASAVVLTDDNADNHQAVSNENETEFEITGNYLASTAVSAPVSEPAINYGSSYNGDDTESVREIATVNTWTAYGDEQDESKSTTAGAVDTTQHIARNNHTAASTVSSSSSSSIRPSPIATRTNNSNYRNNSNVKKTPKCPAKKATVSIMTVDNYSTFKYGGKGFDVWKKNGQRPIYQETKLHITKAFGDDTAGKQKLKRFLMKRAGLTANGIEHMQVVNVQANRQREAYSYAIVTVRDSQQRIEAALEKLNRGKRESVAWIDYPYQYVNKKVTVNRRLFVTGFDILSAKDHRAMTDLFLNFGDLACDITMNKDKNGNPFAVVTYREKRSATACVEFHRGADPMAFNGKELHIRYYNEEKRGNGARNNRNYKNQRRRF